MQKKYVILSRRTEFYRLNSTLVPIPVAARSKAWVWGRSPIEIVGSNPIGVMDVCLLWVLCVLSGRALCDGPITRPGGSYRVWCVVVCDLETSWMRTPWPALGSSATGSTLVLIFFLRLSVLPYNIPHQWTNRSEEGPYFSSVYITSCSTFQGIFVIFLYTF